MVGGWLSQHSWAPSEGHPCSLGASHVVRLPMQETGDAGLIPGSRRSPGEGNDNPLQYSCLKNPMDRGARQSTVHEVAESDTTEPLSTHGVLQGEFWKWRAFPEMLGDSKQNEEKEFLGKGIKL